MSEKLPKGEVPRDLTMAQEVRREITRNSAEISLNFWQEFENIRATQRSRMAGESLRRERINTLMRDGQQEANQEAEALSRSISAQGMITLPMASADEPPPPPLVNSIVEGIKNMETQPKAGTKKLQNSKIKLKTKAKAASQPEKSPTNPSIEASPSAVARISVATASTSKTTPSTSNKMRFNKKNKK
ncbi:hypothetical protein KR038_011246 [Drosophila bunnanda]|nr:hypothetical protein KR038_011246 [Drosophila bunnanda]